MRDMSAPLEQCLQALEEKRNLQDILRRYPAERDELIGMLRLSIELNALGAPAPDPAFRLRARNQMLALAGRRRQAQLRNTLSWLPRPAARLALAGAVAVGLVAAGLTAAAASNDSLPGDALYGVKLGVEQVQLAATFDSASHARLQLRFADLRLSEAQRLVALGRNREAVTVVTQYDSDLAEFNQSVATSNFDERAVTELSRLVVERQANADASLHAIAGSLNARGDSQNAAIVAAAQSHVDEALRGTSNNLHAHQGAGSGADKNPPKPAGAQH
jgi:uncharacterized protein DUF5667